MWKNDPSVVTRVETEREKMEKAIADEVASADVLWYAAERIGKSSSGDEIQKICDYLVK